MKKKEWGNAVWLLFHTLAIKLKEEHVSELLILIFHISQICSNLPCPDCLEHASSVMNRVNKNYISSSNDKLVTFLWEFHNNVNKKIKGQYYSKDKLTIYNSANTINVIKNFINVFSATSNNEKMVMYGFHRSQYIKTFKTYIKNNIHKYNL